MERRIFLILSIFFLLGCNDSKTAGETVINSQFQNDVQQLKKLVDQFSILADKKDVEGQLKLFSNNAVVESYRDGKLSSRLKGKTEIGEAFTNFLSLFETVYHLNGQQTTEINGNRAIGISYCLVVLISQNDEGKVKTTFGVSYDDEYVKEDGKWYIKRRKSHFNWETRELID